MNIQLKKGLVEVCVLALLNTGPSYGYKISEDISTIMNISESTLYPILRRLEISKCLKTYTKDYNGRLRKYYSLTSLGEQRIDDFISEWKEMEKVYSFIRFKGGLK
jgi:PadR family transcriptional regulator PadR